MTPTSSELLDPGKRHLFLFAHQDDEIHATGMIQRLKDNAYLGWVTNADGLYFQENGMPPAEYGRLRVAEGRASARILGLQDDRLDCGDFSEVENYRHYAYSTHSQREFHQCIDFCIAQGEFIDRLLRHTAPDIVWTLAFQGGQPVHDLVHVLASACINSYREEGGKEIQLVALPAYELSILIPLRFSPWYRGTRYCLDLAPSEWDTKLMVIKSYTSQVPLMRNFQRYIGLLGCLSTVFGRPFTYRSYCAKEYFSPVDTRRDFTLPPYRIEFCNYLFDDYLGEPIRFRGMMDRIFATLARVRFQNG